MQRILVVDDDPDILEAIQFVLETDYEVFTDLGDGVERKIQKHAPQLVLMDILLSGKDGRDITKKLKQDGKTKNIPIILLSAHPNIESTIQTCGADDFIPKPFDMNILLSKVEKYITYSSLI
jgi:DNA-binding response OmpR family regulator